MEAVMERPVEQLGCETCCSCQFSVTESKVLFCTEDVRVKRRLHVTSNPCWKYKVMGWPDE